MSVLAFGQMTDAELVVPDCCHSDVVDPCIVVQSLVVDPSEDEELFLVTLDTSAPPLGQHG